MPNAGPARSQSLIQTAGTTECVRTHGLPGPDDLRLSGARPAGLLNTPVPRSGTHGREMLPCLCVCVVRALGVCRAHALRGPNGEGGGGVGHAVEVSAKPETVRKILQQCELQWYKEAYQAASFIVNTSWDYAFLPCAAIESESSNSVMHSAAPATLNEKQSDKKHLTMADPCLATLQCSVVVRLETPFLH